TLQGSMTEAEARARLLTDDMARGAREQSRSMIGDLERIKAETTAVANATFEDMRTKLSTATQEVTHHLGHLSQQVTETSQDVRSRAAQAAADIETEQARLRAEMQRLPAIALESAETARRSLQDQVRALDVLHNFTTREAGRRDVAPPVDPRTYAPPPSGSLMPAPKTAPPEDRAQALSSLAASLSQDYARRPRPQESLPASPPAPQPPLSVAPPPKPLPAGDAREEWSMGDLLKRASRVDEQADIESGQRGLGAQSPAFASLVGSNGSAAGAGTGSMTGLGSFSAGTRSLSGSSGSAAGAGSMPGLGSQAAGSRSMSALSGLAASTGFMTGASSTAVGVPAPPTGLSSPPAGGSAVADGRATGSHGEHGQHVEVRRSTTQDPPSAIFDVLARALDPSTASDLWSRIRSGQRGIMVRSIYPAEWQTVYDQINQRYKTDATFHRVVNQYLTDFERNIAEADRRDPTGRLSQNQFLSDSGRVYLFLAHAGGRLG
ncbi:MAG: hypothetical protein ACREC6_13680, partial [Hyphomicrobiaceae bacterium]